MTSVNTLSVFELAKNRFQGDPDFRSACLSMIYRAHPPGPKCLIDTWYTCNMIVKELHISETEIYDNVGVEIKLRGPVALTHNCDISCQVRTKWNSEEQEALKKDLETQGHVYKGSFRKVLEKLKEVFPITFRT